MSRRPLLLVPLLLAAGACGKDHRGASNTYPGVAGHTWFPLAGTAHEPTPVGAISSTPAIYCKSCHPGDSFKPIAGRASTQINCTDCHIGDPATTVYPSGPDLLGVHTDAAPSTTYPGYASTAAAYLAFRSAPTSAAPAVTDFCRRCHPLGQAYGNLNHTRFPIGAGSKHNRACSVCHTTSGPATTNTADTQSRSNAVRYGALTCVACHMNQAPFTGVFPPPTIDLRHLPPAGQPGGVAGGVGLVRDYPATSIAPRDCMRCHDPVALAPSAGTGNLVLRVSVHGTRQGPTQVGSGRAGPWDGKHGTSGQSVHCWTCHSSVPPLFPSPIGPSVPERPWAQDWSVGPAPSGLNTCSYAAPIPTTQRSCCTDCHGTNPG